MKTKVIFPKRIDGKSCICPFAGYPINNLDEFIAVVKKYFNKETGYPGLFFNTANKDLVILFAGHQYIHGEEGKWAIFNRKTDEWPKSWFKLSNRAEEVLSLFDDKEVLDKKIDAITAIINAQGGITVKV